jgi:hypothetical protein
MPKRPEFDEDLIRALELAPFDRQPQETESSYRYFLIYRDMPLDGGPKRSLTRVAETAGKSLAWMAKLSRQYGWVERAYAYDVYLDRQRLENNQLKEVEARRRHARAAQAAIAAIVQPIGAIMRDRKVRMLDAEGREQFLLVKRADDLDELPTPMLLDLATGAARALQSLASLERESLAQLTSLERAHDPEAPVAMPEHPAEEDTAEEREERVGGILATFERAGLVQLPQLPPPSNGDGSG